MPPHYAWVHHAFTPTGFPDNRTIEDFNIHLKPGQRVTKKLWGSILKTQPSVPHYRTSRKSWNHQHMIKQARHMAQLLELNRMRAEANLARLKRRREMRRPSQREINQVMNMPPAALQAALRATNAVPAAAIPAVARAVGNRTQAVTPGRMTLRNRNARATPWKGKGKA